jgi:hypothetical protein
MILRLKTFSPVLVGTRLYKKKHKNVNYWAIFMFKTVADGEQFPQN